MVGMASEPTKRPRDRNQLTKLIVDIATLYACETASKNSLPSDPWKKRGGVSVRS